MNPVFLIGLMSGTSFDGLDAVLFRWHEASARVDRLVTATMVYPQALRHFLLKSVNEDQIRLCDVSDLAVWHAQIAACLVNKILLKSKIKNHKVKVIGYHGQTLWHASKQHLAWGQRVTSTLQIGDGPTPAALTGIPVVNNFRTQDMAWGGQGAPLVPFAHKQLFARLAKRLAVHNLGGISNLTYLSPRRELGFDTGPANLMIDAVMREHFGKPYDALGRHASRGRVHFGLLHELMQHPFLSQRLPKSTGREDFGRGFLQKFFQTARRLKISPLDQVATATEFTAQSILLAYEQFVLPSGLDLVIFCGGGAKNRYLMSRLRELLPVPIHLSSDFGIDPQHVECMSFGILADFAIDQRINHLPQLTGAKRACVLGQVSR